MVNEQTIWKFVVQPHSLQDVIEVRMPINSIPKSVAFVGGDLCIWAIVDVETAKDTEIKYFTVKGTGHPMTEFEAELPFLGTVFHPLGLVFHVFEGRDEYVARR